MGSDEGRGWKRQKNFEEKEVGVVMSADKVSALRESLKDVCSLDDLRARMEGYISKKGCNEVLSVMSKLCKVNFLNFIRSTFSLSGLSCIRLI